MKNERFRLPWPLTVALLLLSATVISLVILRFILAGPPMHQVILVTVMGFVSFTFTTLVFLMPALSVSADGLVLHGINRLKWSQIKSVRGAKVCWLPYLLVHRHGGFRWFIPLYLRGHRPIKVALIDHAPEGNPMKVFLGS